MTTGQQSSIAERLHRARKSHLLLVDLDIILNNLKLLTNKCASHTQVIAVVKANAYGHGSVPVARFLSKHGFKHFAVATSAEGRELREAGGLQCFVQVFGNAISDEIAELREYSLTPTVCTPEFLKHWAAWQKQPRQTAIPPVVIKVDTGMSRNGCQPENLPALIKLCDELKIPVHSIMTHFAQAWDGHQFTSKQLQTFLQAVQPYRNRIKIHVANSAAILKGYGTDLDFLRPGVCMYGLPPDTTLEVVDCVNVMGLRPALSWIARPTLVKTLPPSSAVGYDGTYRLQKEETIATFGLGYADGYYRLLSSKGILTSMDGSEHPVVGRVSMDAITVATDSGTTTETPFYVYTNDFTSPNSITAVARNLGTIAYEVATSLSHRIHRIYITQDDANNGSPHK